MAGKGIVKMDGWNVRKRRCCKLSICGSWIVEFLAGLSSENKRRKK